MPLECLFMYLPIQITYPVCTQVYYYIQSKNAIKIDIKIYLVHSKVNVKNIINAANFISKGNLNPLGGTPCFNFNISAPTDRALYCALYSVFQLSRNKWTSGTYILLNGFAASSEYSLDLSVKNILFCNIVLKQSEGYLLANKYDQFLLSKSILDLVTKYILSMEAMDGFFHR